MNQFLEFFNNHLLLNFSFFALLMYWILGEIKQRNSGVGSVSPTDATQLINHNNAIVIDVREDKEIEAGSIINSIHIPLPDLENQLKKIEKYKQKPVILACRSGHRSANACKTLRKHEFTQVHNLRGGIMAWQKDSLPLVK